MTQTQIAMTGTASPVIDETETSTHTQSLFDQAAVQS